MPPALELDFRSILGVILAPFLDPPELEKQGFRVEGVAIFEKSRGCKKTPKNSQKTETWLSWNGKRVRRESVQALQARREQREQQEEPEPERQNHQEEQGESGEGRPRIETASA